jgi:hypothetical protein
MFWIRNILNTWRIEYPHSFLYEDDDYCEWLTYDRKVEG